MKQVNVKHQASSFLKLILSSASSEQDEVDRINNLIQDDDLDFFHLRKPGFDYDQMTSFIDKLRPAVFKSL